MAAETTITDLPDAPLPLETTSYVPMDVGATTSKTSLGTLFGEPVAIGSSVPNAGTFTTLQANTQLALPTLSDGLLKNSSGVVTNATEGVDYAPPQSITIVNSAGTTTVLTSASTYIQTIVGTVNQIIELPDETTLVPGPAFLIQNNSTQTVVIQDSAASLIYTLLSGGTVQLFTYSAATPTGNWSVNVLPPGNMANGQMRWGSLGLDMIGNPINAAPIGTITKATGAFTRLDYENQVPGTTNITAAAGTTILTVNSTYNQHVIGTNAQTIQLPDETTLPIGFGFIITNRTAGGVVSINDSAGTNITALQPGGAISATSASAFAPTGNWRLNVIPPAFMGSGGSVIWGTNTLNMGGGGIDNAIIGAATPQKGTFTTAASTVITSSQGALAALGPNTATLTNDGLYADYASNIGRFTNFSGTPAGFGFYSGAAIAQNALGFIPQIAMNGVITNEAYCVIPIGPTPVAVTGGTPFPLFATTGAATGAVTLPIGTYAFESFFVMTGMSTSTNTMSFGITLGTATATTSWVATAAKAGTLINPNAAQICSSQVMGASAITSTFGTANGQAYIRGVIRVTAAGTIIPVGATSVSSTITIAANSYFRVSPISASATIGPVGNWS